MGIGCPVCVVLPVLGLQVKSSQVRTSPRENRERELINGTITNQERPQLEFSIFYFGGFYLSSTFDLNSQIARP